MRAVWRGLSEALGPPLSFLPPCRAPGGQGYSRFPPVAQGKKGQTGQKKGNPRVSPSVGPAGLDSLRVDGQKVEGQSQKPGGRPSLLPFRKVSLGVLTERGVGTPKNSPATSCLPLRGKQAGCSASRMVLSFRPVGLSALIAGCLQGAVMLCRHTCDCTPSGSAASAGHRLSC